MAAIGSNGAGRGGAPASGGRGAHSPELLELAWAELLQEWPTLVKMCQIAVARGREHWHEAMSEVAARLPDNLLTWDPSGGRSLRSHVIGNSRWYLYKEYVWKRRQRERRERGEGEERWRERESQARDAAEAERAALEDGEEVHYLLGALHPYHRAILQLYFMSGLTYGEIGDRLGCSKSTVATRVADALGAARDAAAEAGLTPRDE